MEEAPRTPTKAARCVSQRASELRTAAALPRSLRQPSSLRTAPKKRERQGREELVLGDGHRRKRRFPLLRDADLGLDRRYQVLVHPTVHDDDCDTDEEQLECSRRYCLDQLREGILREFGSRALGASAASSPPRSSRSSSKASAGYR